MIDLTEAWIDWFNTCWLDKCTPEHIAQLCKVSNYLYQKCLDELPANRHFLEQLPDLSSEYGRRFAFHLMETQLVPIDSADPAEIEEMKKRPNPPKSRQDFKKGVFERAGRVGNVTGYLLRAYFRSFINGKNKDGKYLNVQHDMTERASGADKDSEIKENQEFENRVSNPRYNEENDTGVNDENLVDTDNLERCAHEFWASLKEREKAAIFALSRNCCMSDPEILQQVKCSKSVFSELPRVLWPKYIDFAKKQWGFAWEDFQNLKSALHDCCWEWENNSPLGQWFHQNMIMPPKFGMKTKIQKISD